MRIAVFGAAGFVGQATTRRFDSAAESVVGVRSPRLRTAAREVSGLEEAVLTVGPSLVEELSRELSGVDAVVNCAGLARPTASADDSLYGANALLPVVLYRASAAAGVSRFVHVSTAAVLGSGTLRDGWASAARTPYAHSKALGEQGLKLTSVKEQRCDLRILRPTSVHGPSRDVTRTLVRLARSFGATIAGDGSAPSPQVLVERVVDMLHALVVMEDVPQHPLIQPWDGVTVRSILEDLGDGSAPRSLPMPVARSLVALGTSVPHGWVRGQTRRVEMLWFGQAHEEGWLTRRGLAGTLDHDAWRRTGRQVRQSSRP